MANGKGLLSQGQKEQALYKGLLQLGAQLSAGSGGNRPVSTLQALSQGGAGFADAYGQSVDKAKNRAIQQREMDYQDEVRKRESDKLASQAAYRMSLPPSVRQQAEVMGIPQFAAAEYARSIKEPKDERTTLQKDYGLAVDQGYEGSIFDYQQELGLAKSGLVKPKTTPISAELPKIGNDTKLETTPVVDSGFKPIIGTPAWKTLQDIEMKEEKAVKEETNLKRAATNAMSGLQQQTEIVNKTVDEALGLISPYSAGYGSYLSIFPETEAGQLENALSTLKANIGFDKLQRMREASPTGGALGGVSENENKLLQAVNGALDPKQSGQLETNLKAIKELYAKVLAEKEAAFSQDYGPIKSELPEGISEEDILTTMEANNMTRQQVLDRLGAQ